MYMQLCYIVIGTAMQHALEKGTMRPPALAWTLAALRNFVVNVLVHDIYE